MILATVPMAGVNAITALYSGDATHSASVSTAVDQVVAPTTINVAGGPPRSAGSPSTLQPMTPASSTPSVAPRRDLGHSTWRTRLEISTSRSSTLSASWILAAELPSAIRQAIYDPFTTAVTLVPAQRLNVHFRYQLTVNGTSATGVRGATGLLLDGNGDGKAGSNYVADITLATLEGPAPGFARTVKLTPPRPAKAASALAFDKLLPLQPPAALCEPAQRLASTDGWQNSLANRWASPRAD